MLDTCTFNYDDRERMVAELIDNVEAMRGVEKSLFLILIPRLSPAQIYAAKPLKLLSKNTKYFNLDIRFEYTLEPYPCGATSRGCQRWLFRNPNGYY